MAKMFSYNPDPEIWDGSVEVEIPDHAKRVSYRTEFAKISEDHPKLLDRARELALEHTKSCSLTHKESGNAFESLDELDWFAESQDVFIAIGLAVAKGPKLGNVLERP